MVIEFDSIKSIPRSMKGVSSWENVTTSLTSGYKSRQHLGPVNQLIDSWPRGNKEQILDVIRTSQIRRQTYEVISTSKWNQTLADVCWCQVTLQCHFLSHLQHPVYTPILFPFLLANKGKKWGEHLERSILRNVPRLRNGSVRVPCSFVTSDSCFSYVYARLFWSHFSLLRNVLASFVLVHFCFSPIYSHSIPGHFSTGTLSK